MKKEIKEGRICMKRLGIFCFYDKEGVVDSYLDYLLNDLSQNVEQLIIVVNGIVNDVGLEIFKKYTKEIIIRENKGFDAGAYKQVLVDVLGKEEIKKWDEIVLCNDTFYGPFIPFKEIFREMQHKNIDFWGLNYVETDFMSHVQSYFLVFKKNILIKEDLFDYFHNNIDMETEDLIDVYVFFEVGLCAYLRNKGYKFDVYSFVNNCDIYRCPGVCIEDYQFPILKKRCFSNKFFDKLSILKLLNYIQTEKKYDINLILLNIKRLYNIEIDISDVQKFASVKYDYVLKKKPDCVGKNKILEFIKENQKIYIYGTGYFAKQLWFFLHEYISDFSGFVISDDQSMTNLFLYDYPIYHYRDINEGAAILLGMTLENSKSVIPNLKKKDKIMFLWNELISSGGIL